MVGMDIGVGLAGAGLGGHCRRGGRAGSTARIKDMVLLALTVLVDVIALGTGRTTVLQGIVHLVIFAAFLFFAVVP